MMTMLLLGVENDVRVMAEERAMFHLGPVGYFGLVNAPDLCAYFLSNSIPGWLSLHSLSLLCC